MLAILNKAFNDAAKDPGAVKKLHDVEMEVVGGPPERLRSLIRSEIATWNQVTRKHNIQLE